MSSLPIRPSRFPALRLLLASLAALGCLALARLPASPVAMEQRDLFSSLAMGLGLGTLLMCVARLVPPVRERLDQQADDPVQRRLCQRYYRAVLPSMLAYLGVMLFWRRLLDAVGDGWPRVTVVLLPVALVTLMLRAVLHHVRDSDELRRRIALESLAIAAAAVGAGFMVIGFLQNAGLTSLPADTAMLWVFPALCVAQGVARLALTRRYS